MASEIVFLQDLAVVTGIAALASLVFQRLRFPLVFGLLAAGVVIGPHTPPVDLIQDPASIETLANLGIVLVLFGLGLDFNLRSLRRVGAGAAIVTVVEVLLMFWLGYEVGLLIGWTSLDALFLGAMLSISSTAIIVSVLRELGRLEAESSRLVFAVLILEDVLAVLILVLLGGFAASGDLPIREAGLVVAQMAVFLVGTLIFGLLVVPRLLDYVATRFRAEVLVLVVLSLALLGAVASDLSGFHVGLGAFLLGAVSSEAKNRAQIEERFRPVHDLFASVFFVSIGTLIDFDVIVQYWRPVALITIVVVVGKTLSGFAATFLAGYSGRSGVEVGAALAQVGEFSFVIAAVGLATGTMSPFLFPIIIAVAALTSFASPLLIRTGPAVAEATTRLMPAPVRTYASIYTAWMRNLRARAPAASEAARRARRNGIIALVLLAWVLTGAALLTRGALNVFGQWGFTDQETTLIVWGGAAVAAIPLAFEAVREIHLWIATVTSPAPSLAGLGIRGVVQASLYLVALVVVGLPVLGATAPFIRGPFALMLWSGAVLLALGLLWARMRRLHLRVTENIQSLLREEQVGVPTPDVVQALFRRGLPGQVRVDVFPLIPNALAIGRRVGELQLRTSTGATLLMAERASGEQVQPSPDTTFLPGDRLVLIGSPEQLAAARTLLGQIRDPKRHATIQPGQLFVPPSATWVGRTLDDTPIRTMYGLQVVAILRDKETIPNPGPKETIVAEDTLVVLGEPEQIVRARARLEEPRPPTTPAEPPADGNPANQRT